MMDTADSKERARMEYKFLEHRIAGGIGADDRYWESLEEGVFRLPRCAGCARWTWPAHWRCGECGSWDFTWTDVEPVGEVYAWTRTMMVFDQVRERAEQVPYVVALVEVDGTDSTKVLGLLKGSEAGLRVGARVRGAIEPPSATTKGYATVCWTIDDVADTTGASA